VQLDSFYVFPRRGEAHGDSARARLARGAYDGYDSGVSFARHLTDDFAAVSHDKHLVVRFIARGLPPARLDTGAPPAPTANEIVRQRRAADEENCSFEKVERMDGNVGYLKFDGFADADLCAPTVAAAMDLPGRHARHDHRPPRERRRLAEDGRARVVVSVRPAHAPQRSLDAQHQHHRGVLDAG